jgi:GT2 family glycosyltransferase
LTETYPLVSIITLNYNQSELTLQLLQSLQYLVYSNVEILVCDMNSREEEAKILSAISFPNTEVLFSKINRGFAGGNNWGIEQSKGEYILLLNNDTVVEPTVVGNLLKVLQHSKDIGVVSPKIRHFYNKEIIEYAGFRPMNFYTGQTSSIGFNQVDKPEFNQPRETASAHGCAMMIARKTLDSIGGLCDDYFLYYEEWDLSLRLQQEKFKVWYEPTTTVFHLGSQSLGFNNPLKEYFLTRNRILLIRRFATPHQLVIFVLFFTFCSLPVNLFRFVVKKQFAHLKAFIKGVLWNLRNSSKPKFDLYRSNTW